MIEKIRDIVGLYLSPPVAAVVFAVDEKPGIWAINRTAPTLPMLPGTPERASHDYQRNGTIDLLAALDIATGEVIHDLRPTHTTDDFVAFLNKINRNVPPELGVHVILDNLRPTRPPRSNAGCNGTADSTSTSPPPTGPGSTSSSAGSRLSPPRKLQRSAHDSVKALAADIATWIDTWNQDPKAYIWTKTADEILDRLASYCADITGTQHHSASS